MTIHLSASTYYKKYDPDMKAVYAALRAVVKKVGRRVIKLCNETVSTWESKPKFKYREHISPGSTQNGNLAFWVEIYTNDKIYSLINYGAKGKIIYPLASYAISSQWKFTKKGYIDLRKKIPLAADPNMFIPSGGTIPKTTPGSLMSGPGGESGSPIESNFIHWTGITPRRFDEQIEIAAGAYFQELVDDAVNKVLESL